jgi:hypothetical protein
VTRGAVNGIYSTGFGRGGSGRKGETKTDDRGCRLPASGYRLPAKKKHRKDLTHNGKGGRVKVSGGQHPTRSPQSNSRKKAQKAQKTRPSDRGIILKAEKLKH